MLVFHSNRIGATATSTLSVAALVRSGFGCASGCFLGLIRSVMSSRHARSSVSDRSWSLSEDSLSLGDEVLHRGAIPHFLVRSLIWKTSGATTGISSVRVAGDEGVPSIASRGWSCGSEGSVSSVFEVNKWMSYLCRWRTSLSAPPRTMLLEELRQSCCWWSSCRWTCWWGANQAPRTTLLILRILLRACCRWCGLCRQACCEGSTRAPRRILPLFWACEEGCRGSSPRSNAKSPLGYPTAH
jgi:hypothetical protein